ncbi:MAG: DUF3570 domain-containing protein [Flavobacterium sp.]
MKNRVVVLASILYSIFANAQNGAPKDTLTIAKAKPKDTVSVYKKRVLDAAEIEFLGSYYGQNGQHSAVNGGIGTEKLTDATSNIVLTMPINSDDVLTVDAGFSAYTSASSSNINPFMSKNIAVSGASKMAAMRRDDDDGGGQTKAVHYGSPWITSTGASQKDVLVSVAGSYSHSSDDRNTIVSGNASVSQEFDYSSFGIGFGVAKLFNQKNTEVNLKANAYFDTWRAIYPTELHEYALYGANFQNTGYFQDVDVFDQDGNKSSSYLPSKFKEFSNEKRNSYSLSLGFSQILTKNLQVAVFMDVLFQDGLLSTPYHRMYFADKGNYYIGETRNIPNYTSPSNKELYRLADDVERLPGTRFKLPIGARLNYYVNEKLVIRSYYRFYTDDWGLQAHTVNVELPYRISERFTLIPMYRFYTQNGVRYFAPFEKHYSFEKYYTSDYDLAPFDSHQYGLGISYTDILNSAKVLGFGLKNIDLRFNKYERSDQLSAGIVTLGIKFVN